MTEELYKEDTGIGWLERRKVQHLESFVYIPTVRTKDLFLDVKHSPLTWSSIGTESIEALRFDVLCFNKYPWTTPSRVTILDVIDLTDTGRVKNNGESQHRTAEEG